jgi:hypothetical protein
LTKAGLLGPQHADRDAYMALVLNNAQGEPTTLERGQHARDR